MKFKLGFIFAVLCSALSGNSEAQFANNCSTPNYVNNLFHPGCLSWTDLNNSFSAPPAIGIRTPNTGAFTALSGTTLSLTSSATIAGPVYFGGTLSGPGITGIFTAPFASPPPIGNVTPSTGAFTTLSATGAISGAGFTARFATPGPIGNTTPSTAAFTTLGATGAFAHSGREAQIDGAGFNLGSANRSCASGTQWWCTQVSARSAADITGAPDIMSILIYDTINVVDTGPGNQAFGLDITHNIAPFSGSAKGSRTSFNVLQHFLSGGTITNTGISSTAVLQAWVATNLGGISTKYNGIVNPLNTVCALFSGATFTSGCGAYESDIGAAAGSSYDMISHFNLITLNTHAVKGLLNSNFAIQIGAQQGALADFTSGIAFSIPGAAYTFDPFAHLIQAPIPYNSTATSMVAASAIDFGYHTFKAFSQRGPNSQDVPLKATAITGATRLTSDGAAASSFVYGAHFTARGTGYTSNATVTTSDCTGTVINVEPGAGGAAGLMGVYTPGTACKAEALGTVAGGGGSGATAVLEIAGNTLNFSINSVATFNCTVVAYSTLAKAIGWSLKFGAQMDATASTTAIIGSPTWTQDYESGSASAAIAIAAPTADTTFGAINITVTPSSGTWTVGGNCRMTKSKQV